MGVGSFALQLVAVFALTLLLLNKYGNWRKQHLIVSLSTFIGWYFSFLIVLMLPLDVSITFYKKCVAESARQTNASGTTAPFTNATTECEEPRGHIPDHVLLALWRVVYWTSQCLTWLVLPIMQSYSRAGEFSALGKLRSAIYSNALYYGLYAVLLLFLLLYAVSKGVSLNFDHLKVLVVSASNTWGLFLLVVLLGYGLVEVPRQLWQMGNRGYRLQKAHFDIDKLSTDKSDAEEAAHEVYREAREVMDVLKSTRGCARERASLILCKFPHELSKQLSSSRSTNFAAPASDLDASLVSNEAYLIRLHKRVIEAVQNHHRCQAQWRALINKALYLEDVEVAESTQQVPPKWTRMASASLGGGVGLFTPPPSARFLWHVKLKRPVLQGLGATCAAMTLLVMWSECTFFVVHPQLSLAARLLHSAAQGSHYKYIQTTAVAMLAYLGACAYYTVFKLRIYRYYHLDANRSTDENSLIFSAMLLCRLTPPMCLNFLGMVHLDSHVTSSEKLGVETQFTQLMGHLDVVPLVAKGLNIYMPILISVLCLGTWFRLGTHLLSHLGIEAFISGDQITVEMVKSGKALVSLERNRINRQRGKEERNRAWASSTATATNNKAPGGGAEYSDRTPIMEHQEEQDEEDVLVAVEEGGAATRQRLPDPPPPSATRALAQQPSPAAGASRDGDAPHPTPASIFDDL